VAELGDFVSARRFDGEGCIQGVVTRKFRFSIHVEGMLETYACFPDAAVVADKDIWLPEVAEHVRRVRGRLGMTTPARIRARDGEV
jgi:hypothetical protein